MRHRGGPNASKAPPTGVRERGARMIALSLAFSITLVLAVMFSPIPAEAQQQANKVPRIGYLLAANLATSPHLHEAFRRGLRDRGYVEGRNLVIEYRSAEGQFERFPALAAELVALKVEVIVAVNPVAALAAKRSTRTLPVIFIGVG